MWEGFLTDRSERALNIVSFNLRRGGPNGASGALAARLVS
jgi:hypothetical protein